MEEPKRNDNDEDPIATKDSSKLRSKGGANASPKRDSQSRPKRNRKRPRSELHATNINPKTHILPLELDGRRIPGSNWIRVVEPYPYTFSTFAKARWVGRTVLDVYSTEYGSYPKSYYESAIVQGRIMVSDKAVSLEYRIKDGNVLSHTVHRHEPGVAVSLNQPPYVRIVQETEDVLVVDKPGTLPIHPCGGYHMQSLMNLLELQFGKLYTIHRLDRLTCGLVILGKTSTVATDWGKAIMNRNCQKVYLARVAGKFPLHLPQELDRFQEQDLLPDHGESKVIFTSNDETMLSTIDLARKQNAYGYWITNGDGILQRDCLLQNVFASQHHEDEWLDNTVDQNKFLWLHLACPTRISQPKDGICEAGPFVTLDDTIYLKTVKAAETSFGVIRYDEASDSTLVICRPTTGRTHQIRLHLQHLGHSIANDPNYGGDIWYGNPDGQQACLLAQARLDAIASFNQSNKEGKVVAGTTEASSTSTIDVPATENEIIHGVSDVMRDEKEDIHDFIQRTCVWCARSRNTTGATPRDVLEYLVRSPGIWLHAFQYSFHDSQGGQLHCFRCPPPTWAKAIDPPCHDTRSPAI